MIAHGDIPVEQRLYDLLLTGRHPLPAIAAELRITLPQLLDLLERPDVAATLARYRSAIHEHDADLYRTHRAAAIEAVVSIIHAYNAAQCVSGRPATCSPCSSNSAAHSASPAASPSADNTSDQPPTPSPAAASITHAVACRAVSLYLRLNPDARPPRQRSSSRTTDRDQPKTAERSHATPFPIPGADSPRSVSHASSNRDEQRSLQAAVDQLASSLQTPGGNMYADDPLPTHVAAPDPTQHPEDYEEQFEDLAFDFPDCTFRVPPGTPIPPGFEDEFIIDRALPRGAPFTLVPDLASSVVPDSS